MSLSDSQSKLLSKALDDEKPFYCEGSWTFPPEDLKLFYTAREGKQIRSLLFGSDASLNEIQNLVDACEPAPFGLGRKDVLDDTYRKAGKLDTLNFATNLNVASSGLLESVRKGLLGWEDEERPIKAQLYTLNVYDPGSFFKPHRDTARGKTMFGSLVVVLPFPHVGGALHLRHRGQEVVHDDSEKFALPTDSISWVAFYSDVEHEVFKVESGTRVTLTYNLYFMDSIIHPSPTESAFKSSPLFQTFSKVLADPEFLPDGGTLGFGLHHQYSATIGDYEALENVEKCLKGSDAAIFAVARRLGLSPQLKTVYSSYSGVYLCDGVADNVDGQHGSVTETPRDIGAIRIGRSEEEADSEVELEVSWITPKTSRNKVVSYIIAAGNHAELDEYYGMINMVVTVADKASRRRRL